MKRVFLDTETTGFAPGQIGQLSMIIEEDNGEVTGKNYFFDIDYISDSASEATGRDLDFYKEASGGKRFADYKDEIYKILDNSTIIAHNLKFDENFISTEFWRLGIMFKPTASFDTMGYFKDICGIYKNGKVKNPKLSELVGHFSIDNDKISSYSDLLFKTGNKGFHDATFDTTALYIAFCIHRDDLNGVKESSWRKEFCK